MQHGDRKLQPLLDTEGQALRIGPHFVVFAQDVLYRGADFSIVWSDFGNSHNLAVLIWIRSLSISDRYLQWLSLYFAGSFEMRDRDKPHSGFLVGKRRELLCRRAPSGFYAGLMVLASFSACSFYGRPSRADGRDFRQSSRSSAVQ